ncbi:hypothetical protein QM306_29975 [Burkholderia cenocepacia]|nr:hypothetical protein [Burkholderia cenocepacia]
MRERGFCRFAAPGNHDHPVVGVGGRRGDPQRRGERERTPDVREPPVPVAKCAASHRHASDPLIRFAF